MGPAATTLPDFLEGGKAGGQGSGGAAIGCRGKEAKATDALAEKEEGTFYLGAECRREEGDHSPAQTE